MSLNNHHIIYSAEDIQKYFSGKLTPAEMYAMEKAALEDDFLAEAMEGYNEMKELDWEPQLKLLKSKFEEKQSAKVIAMKAPASYALWKVAAAVIVFCSGLAITYLLTTKEPVSENSIAVIQTKQDSVNKIVTVQDNGDTITKKFTPLVEENKKAKQIKDTKPLQKPNADSAYLFRPDIAILKKEHLPPVGALEEHQQKSRSDLESRKAMASAQQNKPEQLEPKSNNATNKPSKEADYYKFAEIPNEKTFKAQAVGADGSPIAFANIRPVNNEHGTYSDATGNFSLKSADSILNIEIKSVGYISGNFTLRSDNPIAKFVLKSDGASLKEKNPDDLVVTGYGTRRKSASMPDSSINVAPLAGWDNYELYIANNLIIPDNILQKNIHGEVIIAFDVKNDGTLKNLKIVKSLCDECDDAALRVITQGPSWKIIKRKTPVGKVIIKF